MNIKEQNIADFFLFRWLILNSSEGEIMKGLKFVGMGEEIEGIWLQ